MVERASGARASEPTAEQAWLDGGVGARVAGRYRILAELGRGGMGAVFRALDESTGRALAIKRLLGNADAKQLALFEREYHTLAALEHAHVVEVYEYGADADGPYYTMELLE